MSTDGRPRIMFVDDNTEDLEALSGLVKSHGRATSLVLPPGDIHPDDLRNADLVVVDYTLDQWIERLPEAQISVRPLNGVALAAVLREHANASPHFPPTGFALITGKANYAGPLPAERRPHVISRLTNVEWFFEKANDSADTAQKTVSLANAIRSLPESVPQHLGTIDALVDYLGAGSSGLCERYRDAVERCRPPIHHLAERSHGLVVLRWLLHRILPHAAFLLDTFHLAARLGVSPDSLQAELGRNSATESLLGGCTYNGPLRDFDGPRWWRDGIEQLLWEITQGNSANPGAVFQALQAKGCARLEPASVIRPVLTLDHMLRRETGFTSRDDAIPLHLDDWPSYAEPAYARSETIEEHPEMKMYVPGNACD